MSTRRPSRCVRVATAITGDYVMNIPVKMDIFLIRPPRAGASWRLPRCAAILAVAYLFFESAAGAATGSAGDSGAWQRRPVAMAVVPIADQGCATAAAPPRAQSRATARGTLPDTGGGPSSSAFAAAAGLLISGLLLRAVAGRRRDAEAGR